MRKFQEKKNNDLIILMVKHNRKQLRNFIINLEDRENKGFFQCFIFRGCFRFPCLLSSHFMFSSTASPLCMTLMSLTSQYCDLYYLLLIQEMMSSSDLLLFWGSQQFCNFIPSLEGVCLFIKAALCPKAIYNKYRNTKIK